MRFRLTGKVRKLLDIKPSQLVDRPDSGAGPQLNEWYVGLTYINRRRVVIFVQARSLFAIVGYDARKARLADLRGYFLDLAEPVLNRSGFSATDISRVLDAADVELCKTTNRSVLGSINDIARCTRDEVERRGGLALADLDRTTDLMNEMPLFYAGGYGGTCALRRLLDGLSLDFP